MFLFRRSPKKSSPNNVVPPNLSPQPPSATSTPISTLEPHLNIDSQSPHTNMYNSMSSSSSVSEWDVPVEDSTDRLSFENQPPFLYYESIARAISFVATTARISLRAAGVVADTALETAKFGTSLSLGIGRSLLVNALSTARNVHMGPTQRAISDVTLLDNSNLVVEEEERNSTAKTEHVSLFHQALDKYTSMTIGVVNNTFSLAELFTLATFHLTTKTVKFSLKAAEETARIFDGLFGSTETSRALGALITMLRQELMNLNDGTRILPGRGFFGTTFATIATLGGITKALTAYACLQRMTAKRTHEARKLIPLYEGIVSVDSTATTTSKEWRDSLLQGLDSVDGDTDDNDVPIKWNSNAAHDNELFHLKVDRLRPTSAFISSSVSRSNSLTQTGDLHQPIVTSLSGLGASRKMSTNSDVMSVDGTRSFIEEASELRRNIETVDDAKSLIEDASHRDDAMSVFSGKSGYTRSLTSLRYTVQEPDDENECEQFEDDSSYSSDGSEEFLEADDISAIKYDSDQEGLFMPRKVSPAESSLNMMFLHRLSRDFSDDYSEVASQAVFAAASSSNSFRSKQFLHPESAFARTNDSSASNQNQPPSIPEDLEIEDCPKSEIPKKSSLAQISEKVKDLVSNKLKKKKSTSPEISPRGGYEESPTQKLPPITLTNAVEISTSSARKVSALIVDTSSETSSIRHSLYQESVNSTMVCAVNSESELKFKESDKLDNVTRLRLGHKRSHSNVHPSITLGKEEPSSPRPLMASSRSSSSKSLSKLIRTATQTRHHVEHHSPSTHSATITTKTSITTTAGASTVAAKDPAPGPTLNDETTTIAYQHYPNPSLLNNFDRYVRFASGAYGRHFMKIFGIGRVRDVYTSDPSHHPNHYAFSMHTGIPLNCIISSSYTVGAEVGYTAGRSSERVQEELDESQETLTPRGIPFGSPRLKPLIHYVVVDHERKCVVLSLRGTMGLSDLIHDALFTYIEFDVPGEINTKKRGTKRHFAHGGMLRLARKIAEKNERNAIFASVKRVLEDNPGYGLVLCGHSLGGGVAALISIFWSCLSILQNPANQVTSHVTSKESGLPPGRPIHCYSFGSPSCVSHDLANGYCRGLVSSIINGGDLFPSLSLGLVHDLKTVVSTLLDPEQKGLSEQIIGKALGLYRNWNPVGPSSSSTALTVHEEDEFYWSIATNLRESLVADKLYPPGVVYWIQSSVTSLKLTTEPTQPQQNGKHATSWFGRPPTGKIAESSASSAKTVENHLTSRIQLYRCEDVRDLFGELRFSQTMLSDHTPKSYEDSIGAHWTIANRYFLHSPFFPRIFWTFVVGNQSHPTSISILSRP